jgi:DNA invertase Pin-like site-specific DNA recombinase
MTERDDHEDRRKCRRKSARRTGISYRRFSDPKQGKGDSEDRQDRDYRGFCKRHNLTPLVSDEDYTDRGRSGFHDEHRKKGKLGRLVAAAKDGAFESGDVVVVEAWDRLGRLRPDKQINLVQELLQTGVDIGVCRLDDIFTEADFGTHKWITLAVFIELAYQESLQKSERHFKLWEKRRERARKNGKFMAGELPGWLQRVNGEIVPIPERVAAVRRIFRLSGDGFGAARIMRTLIAEKHLPFGSSGKWNVAYLDKILNDRRVLGEMQPRHTNNDPAGPVIANYFPRVIEDDEFNLARAGQVARRQKVDTRGRKQVDKLGRPIYDGPRDRQRVNVFQSLLVSALDGEPFILHNRGSARKTPMVLLNNAGVACRAKSQTFPYDVLEKALLWEALPGLDPADVLPRTQTENPSVVETLRARLKSIRADIAGLQADLKDAYSKHLSAVLRDKEAEEEKVAGELQDELAKSARTVERAWEQMPRLAHLIETEGDAARLRIRPVLRAIVSDARMLVVRCASWSLAATQFWFVGGGHRSWLICYRQACRFRPGGAWADSLTDVGKLGPFDLRKPDRAAALAEVLAHEFDVEKFTTEKRHLK